MRRSIPLLIALAALALGGCDRRSKTDPVVVSAIGPRPAYADPGATTLADASALLMGATAQGLVRLDAAGQIEPGLAERWTVIDDGASYIFRLRQARWNDGKPVTAEQVVAILRRQIGPHSSNPLAHNLTAIDQIVAMTPEVIEIHLARPRPDMLRLLAQPELGIFRTKPPGGSGPMAIDRWLGGGAALLRPGYDADRAADEDTAELSPADDVTLIGERAALAILRFAAHQSDLVTGGRFVDWPLIAGTTVPPSSLHRDPATGLFGFAVTNRDGFLADPGNRFAVAEAIDRDGALAAIAPDWPAATALLPAQFDSAAAPAQPAWAALSFDARRADAARRIASWTAAGNAPPSVRIALPDGPGATLLYGTIGASLIAVGITPQRVAEGADADLRLIDTVAPIDNARWYLVNACQPCSVDAVAALSAARLAPTLAERGTALATADRMLAQDVSFIPLGAPLRWSMVAPPLDLWQANSRAWHPLNHLRSRPN
ncbi:ABC transporter substrate-binding protein [Sphingomonas koreensis]|nr:ABC transporter substrate-binding protein [Sphingomonas koreensis]